MHRNCSSTSTSSCSSCGLFHPSSNSFSMLYCPFTEVDSHSITTSSSSSSVDCTLSLGTPSTRQSENTIASNKHRRWSGSFMSNLCWGALSSKHPSSPAPTRGSGSVNINTVNGDPLLARRCANCDTTSTPLWRNGPRGPKSLCNACGIRYKKEERRATAAATAAAPGIIDSQHHHHLMSHQYTWNHHAAPPSTTIANNEFRFGEDGDNGRSETGTSTLPFLSWHLSVAERPGLVHDYS